MLCLKQLSRPGTASLLIPELDRGTDAAFRFLPLATAGPANSNQIAARQLF
jgi:hypothetical protein